MRFENVPLPARELLQPEHLNELALDLDAAGDACKAMALRTLKPTSRIRHLARASACYGAAHLLRKIAE